MKLEERVTMGSVVYVSSINYDPIEKRLTIMLVSDPESTSVVRVLTFFGIEDFSDEKFEDEEAEVGINFIDSLIGLDEYPEKEGVCYVVHTELREMVFRTKEKPQVEAMR